MLLNNLNINLLFRSKSSDNSDCCLGDSLGSLLLTSCDTEHPPEQSLVIINIGGDGLVRVGSASVAATQLVIDNTTG